MNRLSPVAEDIGLSDEQIRSFWVDGFLVIDGVFPEEDIELLREAAAAPEVARDWRKQDVVNLLGSALERGLRQTSPQRKRGATEVCASK